MTDCETKRSALAQVIMLVGSLLLLFVAVLLWVYWASDLWPPDKSHQSGGMGAFFIYLICRGVFGLLVLAGPLGATIFGFVLALFSISSAKKAFKGVAIISSVANGGCAALLLSMLVYNIVIGFSFK